jgi:hypothetical protein
MKDYESFFTELYQNFNERNIDRVIENMTEDVKWANGMEGGFVYGHEGVREYWTRQFKLVDSNVTPLEIKSKGGVIKIRVHQVVHDLNKSLLSDEIVQHIFHLRNGKIAAFEIMKKTGKHDN